MPLYLTESEVEQLLTPADVISAVEACFERLARGEIENRPRSRVRGDGGVLAVMPAVDRELRLAGLKSYAATPGGTSFVVRLFDLDRGEPTGVI